MTKNISRSLKQMRQTYFQAYQQVLEAEQKNGNRNEKYSRGMKTRDVSNDKFIKPTKVRRTVGKMGTIQSRVDREVEYDTNADEPSNVVIHASQTGIPTSKSAREYIRSKDVNAKFRGEMKSPFYDETKGRCSPESGVFSQDENSVAAAISQNVPTNKAVNSKAIKDYNNFNDDFNIGQVDALTYQCYNGNDINARLILKAGYNVPKTFAGLNPITASIKGRNINTLKLVLSVPKIAALINRKDGFGNYPIEEVAKIRGIDPYEFAKILIEYGARDDVRTDSKYSAAMLTLVNRTWTPNMFGELLAVTDLEKRSKEKLTLREIAEKVGNREAVIMIDNYLKFGTDSINQSVTHSSIINRV